MMDATTDRVRRNREIMAEVADALFVSMDAEKFGSFVSDDQYIQHNPEMIDGKAAVLEYIADMPKKTAHLNGTVGKVLVDGDFGIIHSCFTPKDGSPGGVAVIDIFRIEDGKLVEHWDVMQHMPEDAINPRPMI